jgi:hypothetical protein
LTRPLTCRPHLRRRKRLKPCTVRPFHSVVDVEWQCGQSITSCSPAKCIWNLSIDASPDKLP